MFVLLLMYSTYTEHVHIVHLIVFRVIRKYISHLIYNLGRLLVLGKFVTWNKTNSSSMTRESRDDAASTWH